MGVLFRGNTMSILHYEQLHVGSNFELKPTLRFVMASCWPCSSPLSLHLNTSENLRQVIIRWQTQRSIWCLPIHAIHM